MDYNQAVEDLFKMTPYNAAETKGVAEKKDLKSKQKNNTTVVIQNPILEQEQHKSTPSAISPIEHIPSVNVEENKWTNPEVLPFNKACTYIDFH